MHRAGVAAITIAAVGKRVDENTSKVFDDALADSLLGMSAPANEPGSSLFVINLCASQAPFPTGNKTLPGLDTYRLYQVARREDGRTRYRLRLGFFTSEVDAEAALATVREQYPTAFTTCLCEEDKRYARGYVPTEPTKRTIAAVPTPAVVSVAPAPAPLKKPATPSRSAPAAEIKQPPAKAAAPTSRIEIKSPAAQASPPPVATKPTVSSVELGFLEDLTWEPPALTQAAKASIEVPAAPAKPVAKKPEVPAVKKPEPKPNVPTTKAATPKPAPVAKPPIAHKPEDTSASVRVKALDLTFSDPPVPTAKPTAPIDGKPFHVGKGVEIPTGALDLQLESAPPAPTQAVTVSSKQPIGSQPAAAIKPVAASVATPGRQLPPPAAKTNAPAAAQRKPAVNTDLDSTQTIRALTNAEMNDEAQEKWFAIQLAASEQPVNLDAMPHLDIFEAYCLYSVATAGSGKIVHSLRLGFFKEAASAEAVSGYLKTFFNSPSVLRISVAEHARFKDAPTPLRPSAQADSKSGPKIVELNNARTGKSAVPTVTMEVVPGRKDTGATGSFKLDQTGSFNTSATGSFKTSVSGSHRALTPTLKPAAKSARPATKRSEPLSKNSTTGRYKATAKKSLSEQLLDEARGVDLSESAIRRLPKNDSLLSRLVDKLKK
jgi:sporulation related protein